MKYGMLFCFVMMCLSAMSADNLALGNPGKADKVVAREGYALGYARKYGQAVWAQYRLTKEMTLSKNAVRTNDFRPDPDIPAGGAKASDYSKSGYDKGHLVPAEDMRYSEKTMRESFYLSNMCPQTANFNRGVWRRLEAAVRRFAYSEGAVCIVTGPIFGKKARVIGDGLKVPTEFYKVVYDETPPCKMIAFIIPNEGSDSSLKSFVCTVDTVEEKTGLDFFSKLPANVQADLETRSSPSEWTWK